MGLEARPAPARLPKKSTSRSLAATRHCGGVPAHPHYPQPLSLSLRHAAATRQSPGMTCRQRPPAAFLAADKPSSQNNSSLRKGG